MPLDPSVDKIRVRGRVQTQAGGAGRPPTLFPTVATIVNKVAHSLIQLASIDPSANQTDGTASAPAYFSGTTGTWWADVIAVDDADVLAAGQTQWGQWGVSQDRSRFYVEPKLVGSATFYGDPVTGAPLAQGSGGIRTVWLDDLVQLADPTAVVGALAYTDEQAQDAVAALLAAGTHVGISWVYDDAGNRLSATVTVTGDLPEAADAASPRTTPAPAGDLLGRTTRFTGSVAQPAPAATVGRVFAVGAHTPGVSLTAANSDVFVDDAGNTSTSFTPPTVGVRTLHCSVAGQWRTASGHVPTGVLDARYCAPTDVQVFTSTGTWTKPAGARSVDVLAISSGGGGGSGRRGAAGTVRCGGGGGASGGASAATYRATDLPATVPVTVSAPGAGGAAVTADNTDGAAGTAGAASAFEPYVRTFSGGSAGAGGSATGGAGGAAQPLAGGTGQSLAGGSASATGGVGGAGTSQHQSTGGTGQLSGCGGGAGGGISSGDVAGAGGAGGIALYVNGQNGTGGVVSGAAPTNRTAPGQQMAGGAGGGAASTSGAGQAGAAGGAYGAGGGGGGASVNGSNSGAGGAGGAGVVVVITHF